MGLSLAYMLLVPGRVSQIACADRDLRRARDGTQRYRGGEDRRRLGERAARLVNMMNFVFKMMSLHSK